MIYLSKFTQRKKKERQRIKKVIMKKPKQLDMSDTELTIQLLMNETSWEKLSMNQNLSNKFIERYQEHLNWNLICEWHKLTQQFIKQYYKYINWSQVCNRGYVDDEILDTYFMELYTNPNFGYIFSTNKNTTVTCYLIERYVKEGYFNSNLFKHLSDYKYLTDDFIKKYSDKLDWNNLSEGIHMTENVISKNFKHVVFNKLSFQYGRCKLSQKFISKYILNKLSTDKIIRELSGLNSIISLSMLENINNKQVWDYISEDYDLSFYTIKAYSHKLNKSKLKNNWHINKDENLKKRLHQQNLI